LQNVAWVDDDTLLLAGGLGVCRYSLRQGFLTCPVPPLIRCFAYPDATIVDPGPGQPSYCGGSGDGCIHCYEVVVVP